MTKYVDSLKELFTYYICLLLVCAASFALFEHKPFWDSLWWACVTATTVGYGDMFPVTLGGRITGVILAHIAIFFVLPLTLYRICDQLVENRNEFNHEEQEEIKEMLRRIEAK